MEKIGITATKRLLDSHGSIAILKNADLAQYTCDVPFVWSTVIIVDKPVS